MAITYVFDKQGGFYVADDELEVVGYAYPTSTFAEDARRNPDRVAREMMSAERHNNLGFYKKQPWWADHMRRMTEGMESAIRETSAHDSQGVSK